MMKETIKIYRGDAAKIREFQLNKTRKHCLVGQGIYLTDSAKIAETYRTKGIYTYGQDPVLFLGEAKDRRDALEKALPVFASQQEGDNKYRQWCRKSKGYVMNAPKEVVDKYRSMFFAMVDGGQIVADYVGTYFQGMSRSLRVHRKDTVKTGYLTEFVFDKHEFNTSVFKVDGYVRDELFWRLMWDNNIAFCVNPSDCADFTEFLKQVSNMRITGEDLRTATNHTYSAMKRVLKPYGYRGLEYEGGVLIGGFGRHRAFVVWDEEFVNDNIFRRVA